MRLKLSDKVLRNFFILPIFSAGCGSMRSHIWATQSRGNFPKLVQSGAQTTAGARGAGKAAPPPPPSPSRAGSRRAGLGGERGETGGRLSSGLGRRWAGGGVLGGAGGGRDRRRRPGSAPHRRRPAHFPSFVTESCAAGSGGGAAGGGAEAGRGQGAGAGGRRGREARAGRSSQRRVLGVREKKPPRGTPAAAAAAATQLPPWRWPPGAGPRRDLGSPLGARVLCGPLRPAGVPAAPPSGRPRAPPSALPPRPRARGPGPAEAENPQRWERAATGDPVSGHGEATERKGAESRSLI